jgi:hypothetical protein
LNEYEGTLDPTVVRFVDRNVRSLLTWDILVFFYRNPEAVLDIEGLASRLGRRPSEIGPEVEGLCQARILNRAGGLIRYKPDGEMSGSVQMFIDACQDRGRRLALIALVLRGVNPS